MDLMDRELSSEFKRKQRLKLYGMLTLFVLLISGVFFAFKSFIKPTISRTKFTTAITEIGSVEATINGSGVVIPEYELLLTSPINGKIEKIIHNAGEHVKMGESIVQINKQSTLMLYDQLQDEQEVNKNKVSQLRLTLQKNLNDLETQYSIKELKIKSLETALLHEKSLLDVGGSTKENVKQAELNLSIAQFELKQLARLINNQKEMVKVDVNSLGFQMKIQEKSIHELKSKLKLAEIQSPRDGVITWVKNEIGSSVSEGSEMARVADLSSFKVEGSISDSYASQLKSGGMVIVRVNEEDLRGTITYVQPKVENGIIKFMINLQQKNSPSLRSNAKVDVFVVTSFKDKVVRIKNGPTFNGSVEQTLFVINGDEAIARKVKIGESNFDHVEIASGLKPGEEVMVSDMQEYIHQDKLLIK